MKCSTCKGTGKEPCVHNYGLDQGCLVNHGSCVTCNGTGEVSASVSFVLHLDTVPSDADRKRLREHYDEVIELVRQRDLLLAAVKAWLPLVEEHSWHTREGFEWSTRYDGPSYLIPFELSPEAIRKALEPKDDD